MYTLASCIKLYNNVQDENTASLMHGQNAMPAAVAVLRFDHESEGHAYGT